MTRATPTGESPFDTAAPRRILVVGASGTLGGAVTSALLSRGAAVRALVRRRREGLATAGVERVVGDLADPATLRSALREVAAAFYVSPHEENEVELARTFVRECNQAGVRIVFAGVHVSSRTLRSRLELTVMRVMMPAYRPKLAIGQLIERSAAGPVIFVPTSFFNNDELFLDDILAGTYPMPLRGVNRVAVSDVGEACARALLDPTFPEGTFGVCGSRSLSGAESARVWTEALGRPVVYTGADPAAWSAAADLRLPPGKKGHDFRASFRLLGRLSIPTFAADVARTTSLLGRPPVEYADYVRGIIASRVQPADTQRAAARSAVAQRAPAQPAVAQPDVAQRATAQPATAQPAGAPRTTAQPATAQRVTTPKGL